MSLNYFELYVNNRLNQYIFIDHGMPKNVYAMQMDNNVFFLVGCFSIFSPDPAAT